MGPYLIILIYNNILYRIIAEITNLGYSLRSKFWDRERTPCDCTSSSTTVPATAGSHKCKMSPSLSSNSKESGAARMLGSGSAGHSISSSQNGGAHELIYTNFRYRRAAYLPPSGYGCKTANEQPGKSNFSKHYVVYRCLTKTLGVIIDAKPNHLP